MCDSPQGIIQSMDHVDIYTLAKGRRKSTQNKTSQGKQIKG